jgi:hypothetical protein
VEVVVAVDMICIAAEEDKVEAVAAGNYLQVALKHPQFDKLGH